jgi:peptidoglycan hydrolase FlgJ
MDATSLSDNSVTLQDGKRLDKGRPDPEKEKKLRKACADFEAIFINYIFKAMRQTVPKNDYMPQMPGKDTYSMIMDQKVAEDLSRRGGGIGLQKMLYEQLSRSAAVKETTPLKENDSQDSSTEDEKPIDAEPVIE